MVTKPPGDGRLHVCDDLELEVIDINSRTALEQPVCRLSRELYLKILDIPFTAMPDSWLDQVTRAVLSVGSNWCEGIGKRGTPKAAGNSYRIARGSGYEAAFQLHVAELAGLEELAHEICDIMDAEIVLEAAARVPEAAVEEEPAT